MKLARVFLLPDGGVWFDVPIRPDQDCQTVFTILRSNGAIVTPDFIAPAASVHHIQTLVVPDQPGAQPTFFTSGEGDAKPN